MRCNWLVQVAQLSNRIFLELISSVIVPLNIIVFKTIKYTTRYSVKSSTIYKERLIFFLYSLCSKTPQIMCDRFSITTKDRVHKVFLFLIYKHTSICDTLIVHRNAIWLRSKLETMSSRWGVRLEYRQMLQGWFMNFLEKLMNLSDRCRYSVVHM